MRATFLDPTLESEFDRDGFVVVPFLDADDIARLAATYWRLGPAPGDTQMTIHFDFQSESTVYKNAVSEATRPILEPRVESLLDRFHLFSPSFIMKWPGARSGFAPHQDSTLVDESSFRSVTIWCPLTDTLGADGRDNGILRFVPGSHKFVTWIRAHDPGSFAFAGLEQQMIDEHSAAVPLRAGEAVLFDHRTVHFSMPNTTPESRLVIAMGLRPEETDLLHYRRTTEESGRTETFDIYEIDDDYFIRLNPFTVRDGIPGYRQVDRITMSRPDISSAELRRMCSASESTRPGGGAGSHTGQRVNADPFCFRCGTTTELTGDPGNADHGNVQLLCRRCAPSGR